MVRTRSSSISLLISSLRYCTSSALAAASEESLRSKEQGRGNGGYTVTTQHKRCNSTQLDTTHISYQISPVLLTAMQTADQITLQSHLLSSPLISSLLISSPLFSSLLMIAVAFYPEIRDHRGLSAVSRQSTAHKWHIEQYNAAHILQYNAAHT
jgi:hypothetical protein